MDASPPPLFFYFPNTTYDSEFRNRRIVAVVEGSVEALVKSCVISPYHLFAKSHENHPAAMKSKWNFINMWDASKFVNLCKTPVSEVESRLKNKLKNCDNS